MKNKIKNVIIFSFGFVLLSLSIFLLVKKIHINNIESSKELINISKLSDDFMNNYIEETKELSKDKNKDNILIVISKIKIKDGYGAEKIIEAPNNTYILKYETKDDKEKALTNLKDDKNILSVNENSKYEFTSLESGDENNSYNSWGIEAMGLDSAISNLNGKTLNNVTVAILDTGVDVDLFNKYFNGKLIETYNAFEEDNRMYDNFGHGTHIAGTIAEGTPENVKILPVKMGDKSGFYDVDMLAAINWVVYYEKANVVNMSFGGNNYSEAIYQAIEAAKQKNIVCIAAAGNESTSQYSYPASFDNTISISSIDSEFNLSEFSNYGDKITFAAPGTNIKSIMGSYTALSQNNIDKGYDDGDDDFEVISGTSMATPHAVCAAAILFTLNNNLTFDNVIDLLKKRSLDLGEFGYDEIYGNGLINYDMAQFCDGTDCDDYNVFKNNSSLVINRMDFGNDVYESMYNYGNNTNILNMKAKFYYTDVKYITRDLGELPGVEIENYDPNLEGIQNITIKYDGKTYNKMVNNHLNKGWNFSIYNGSYGEGLYLYKINYEEGNFPKYVEISEDIIPSESDYDLKYIGQIFHHTDIKKIKITAPVKELDFSTFASCDSLELVELPETLETIGEGAFILTKKLKSITLPTNLKEIGERAFSQSGLTKVTIPGSVKVISKKAFANNDNLEQVIIEDGVEEILSGAFATSKLKSIIIPKTITKIEAGAFELVDYLKTIEIDSQNLKYENKKDSNTIVEKETNRLLYANDFSVIPENVTTLASYSINYNSIFFVPETITTIEEHGLGQCGRVVFPKTEINIADNVILDNKMYFVYEDSYVHDYFVNNYNSYFLIDSEIETYDIRKNKYNAFDEVKYEDLQIDLLFDRYYYNFELNEWINVPIPSIFYKNVSVTYQTDEEKFIYGDDHYILSFDSLITGKHYEKKVNVEVDKIMPKYNVPTNLEIIKDNKLSDLVLPSGFFWMNPNEVANEVGNHLFLAKYVPEDTNNYETVENIEIEVKVIENIVYRKIIFNKNDGSNITKEQSVVDLSLTKLDKNDFEREGFVFKNWNTISNGQGQSYSDEEEISISEDITLYAIWEEIIDCKNDNYIFDEENMLIKNIDINTSIEDFKNNFELSSEYEINVEYKEIDGKKVLYTGGKTTITKNEQVYKEYKNIVIGDTDGNGKMNYLDYVNVYNHIQKVKNPSSTKKELVNEYLISADISGDSKINYLDYVGIYKKIKELKGGK